MDSINPTCDFVFKLDVFILLLLLLRRTGIDKKRIKKLEEEMK